MTLKKRLAREIIAQLGGEPAALEAEKHFEKVFQRGEMPEEIPEYHLPHGADSVDVIALLVNKGFARSRSDAIRLVKQGAVEKDHEKLADSDRVLQVKDGTIFEVGKRRRCVRIVVDTP